MSGYILETTVATVVYELRSPQLCSLLCRHTERTGAMTSESGAGRWGTRETRKSVNGG